MKPEDEFREELESHLQMRADLNRANGMSPETARRAAERAFGNQAQIAENVRAVRIPLWLDHLRQDLQYAWRGLRRSPAFTVTALAALAIGIGSSTAVFSFTDRILFRPLPYANEHELVWFGMTAPIAESEFLLSYDYDAWRKQQTAFTSMTSTSGVVDCELLVNDPFRLRCANIDPEFLPLFGYTPALGRNFTEADDQFGAPPTVLISNELWHARFAANPAVLSQPIDLDGRPVRIIGVLPANFETPTLAHIDIVRPHQHNPRSQMGAFLYAFARLKPGVTTQEAAARLQPLFQQSMKTVPLAFRKDVRFAIHPLRERQIRDTRRPAQLLLAAVLFVLLISIANVANLLLARAASRRRELAVRAAIGAGWSRLLRQSLTESLLIGAVGGLAGAAVAAGLLKLFLTIAPTGIPRLDQAKLDTRVLLAAFGLSLLSGLAFGLAPALQKPALETLTGGRVAGRRHHWLRPGLVIVQFALSLVLLCGAGLLLHSLWNLANTPLGMTPQSLLAVQAQLPRLRYPERAQQLAFWETVEQRLARLPGVSKIAVSNSIPPSGQAMVTIYSLMEVQGRGRAAADGVGGMVVIRQVTPGYFPTLQIPIRRGRGFTEDDRQPGEPVTIVDETLAGKLFPNQDPIGQRIKSGNTGWMEVVGVAANVRNAGLDHPSDPEFYMVKRHLPDDGRQANTVVLSAPAALAPAIRDEFRRLDPRLTIQIDTLEQKVSELQARPRFHTLLLGGFALTGLVLAAIGLYGVIALLVAQRTSEIGVRMALGATPAAIRHMVLKQATRWLAAGLVLGLATVALTVKYIESLLYGTPPTAPLPLILAITVLIAAALCAAWLPARRAAEIEPVQALRYE